MKQNIFFTIFVTLSLIFTNIAIAAPIIDCGFPDCVSSPGQTPSTTPVAQAFTDVAGTAITPLASTEVCDSIVPGVCGTAVSASTVCGDGLGDTGPGGQRCGSFLQIGGGAFGPAGTTWDDSAIDPPDNDVVFAGRTPTGAALVVSHDTTMVPGVNWAYTAMPTTSIYTTVLVEVGASTTLIGERADGDFDILRFSAAGALLMWKTIDNGAPVDLKDMAGAGEFIVLGGHQGGDPFLLEFTGTPIASVADGNSQIFAGSDAITAVDITLPIAGTPHFVAMGTDLASTAGQIWSGAVGAAGVANQATRTYTGITALSMDEEDNSLDCNSTLPGIACHALYVGDSSTVIAEEWTATGVPAYTSAPLFKLFPGPVSRVEVKEQPGGNNIIAIGGGGWSSNNGELWNIADGGGATDSTLTGVLPQGPLASDLNPATPPFGDFTWCYPGSDNGRAAFACGADNGGISVFDRLIDPSGDVNVWTQVQIDSDESTPVWLGGSSDSALAVLDGYNSEPESVPEFSLTTMLLAVLLSGFVLMFVIRRRR